MWPYCEHETSYGTSISRVHQGHPENQIPSEVGQDDLFETLEVELGHINIISNISFMQWNLEVQPTSNYFIEMALQVYLRIRSC